MVNRHHSLEDVIVKLLKIFFKIRNNTGDYPFHFLYYNNIGCNGEMKKKCSRVAPVFFKMSQHMII